MDVLNVSDLAPVPVAPFLPRAALVARFGRAPAPLILLAAPPGSGRSMTMLAFARAEAEAGRAAHWIDPADLAGAPLRGALLIGAGLWPTEGEAALMAGLRQRLMRQTVLIALPADLPPVLRAEWIAGRAALFGAGDLAFDLAETACLFGQGQPSRELRLLWQATQGWPLGLGLLSREAEPALGLMRRDGLRQPLPPSLSQWCDDWLAGALPPLGQRLMMDLAVFEHFPAAVVQALPQPEGVPGDLALLAPVLGAGLFVQDCAARPGWLRMMPVLARHLRDRLGRYHPARAAEIRRFALEWSARHHDAPGQMRHGLAVWSPDEAMAEMDRAGAIRVSLAVGPDLDLAQPITAASARSMPLAFFGMIYERIRLGAFEEARVHYANAEALTEGFTRFDRPQDSAQIRGWIAVFAAVVQISADAPPDPGLRREIEAGLRDAISRDPVLAMAQSTVAMLMALNAGAREAALAVARVALHLQERSRVDKAAIFVHLHQASAWMAAARLEEAEAACRAAARLAVDHSYADSYEMVACQIHAGLCAFEAGDAGLAETLLAPCHAQLPRIHGWRRIWLEYFTALAEIAFQAKGLAAAESWITRGQMLAEERDQPQLALGLALCRVDLMLRQGQTAAARAGFADLAPGLAGAAPQITHAAELLAAEIRLAEGNLSGARAGFAALDRAALAAHDLRLELRALALGVEIARQSTDAPALSGGLDAAVALARHLPRIARLPQMRARLRLAQEALLAMGFSPDAAVRDFCAGLAPRGRALLSPREHQIIALIAEGLSTKEIARLLGSSEGTVKSHRKNLYEKLNVSARSKAIARAKALGLLPGAGVPRTM